jgi:single-strand DNA-binding protein
MSFNRIQINGYLGRDAETKVLPNGTTVATFSVATSEKIKGDEVTTWFRVSLFGKQAESLAQYLLKGTQVDVLGRLRQSEFTDKDGNHRTSLEVVASDVQLIGKKDTAKVTDAGAGNSTVHDDEQEIPF